MPHNPSFSRSQEAFQHALELFPGGVNSPVRSFAAVSGSPLFFSRGKGAYLEDLDGRRYLDFVQSWGAHILGHSPPGVVRALRRQAQRLTSVGAPTLEENRLGTAIRDAFPSIERLRFVSSGTEAVMSALRLARAATNRSMILKFDGGYHGHADSLLVSAGSGLATLNQPASAGVPEAVTGATVSVPYNDLEAVRSALAAHPGKFAAIIVEPVAANMGLVLPQPRFLEGLRSLSREHGALLIFDEVITGFRLTYGGASQLFGVEPDLTILGKIIGGGLPVGAYGGKKELLSQVAPLGPVYQAGTLSGNPLAMASGYAVLKELAKPGFYEMITDKAERFFDLLLPHLDPARHTLNRLRGLFTLFFAPGPIQNFADAQKSDTQAYARWFHGLLESGISIAPAQFEAGFIGAKHPVRALRLAAETMVRLLETPSPGTEK
ncbi:MAG: glutamate-1-semialdehyde 2,1-aminomutase [Spirochaetales bacterium]|nr:glutamate-1-semialdehyde 2,1-aminomutase [Spirochaetales bacterium]